MQSTKYDNNRNRNVNPGISLLVQLVVLIIIASLAIPAALGRNNVNLRTVDEGNAARTANESNVDTASETVPVDEVQPAAIAAPQDLLEIHQFNVSCANAQMIRYQDLVIFIDGGPEFKYESMCEQMARLGVNKIDIYIATHWHGDHVSNMQKLLKNYGHSNTLVYGPSTRPDNSYRVANGTYMQFKVGDVIPIGNIAITCVGPYEVKVGGKENPDSLNFVIQHGEFRAMITGDYVYNRAVEDYPELTRNLDVMQMPHHGLKAFSISTSAMSHCNPETLLVPANVSKKTSEFVNELNLESTVLDNSDGHIVVVSNGSEYKVFTHVTSNDDIVF